MNEAHDQNCKCSNNFAFRGNIFDDNDEKYFITKFYDPFNYNHFLKI